MPAMKSNAIDADSVDGRERVRSRNTTVFWSPVASARAAAAPEGAAAFLRAAGFFGVT